MDKCVTRVCRSYTVGLNECIVHSRYRVLFITCTSNLITHCHVCHVGAYDVREYVVDLLYRRASCTDQLYRPAVHMCQLSEVQHDSLTPSKGAEPITNCHVCHVGAQDVREYIVDLLWQLSEVQHYDITPSKGAKPLTHRTILDAFMFDRDKKAMLEVYPWLRCGLDN